MTNNNTALQHLCEDYGRLLKRPVPGRRGLEEAIGSVEFKLEEASAIVQSMQSEMHVFEAELVPALVMNSKKLQLLYAKLDLIHVCPPFHVCRVNTLTLLS